MEAFLQNIACHIFQEAAQKKRHNEGRAYGEFQWGQPLYHDGDQRRTGAVDREPRAGQKAAVDETVKLKVLQCDLDAPAKESIGSLSGGQSPFSKTPLNSILGCCILYILV